MNPPTFFKYFPEKSEELTVSNAIAYLIDGIGFRYYWALEGLEEKDCDYRLSEDSSSISEIICHIHGLINWVYKNIYGQALEQPKSILDTGMETLVVLEKMRKHFIKISDIQLNKYRLDDQPFWDYINRPLSDALNHVGQVRILRRGAGNPVGKKENFGAKRKN